MKISQSTLTLHRLNYEVNIMLFAELYMESGILFLNKSMESFGVELPCGETNRICCRRPQAVFDQKNEKIH